MQSQTFSTPDAPRWRWLPVEGRWRYHALLLGLGILVLGPLGGVTASYMNFSLGFFVGGQVLAGILGTNRRIQFRYQVAGILVGALLAVGLARLFMAAYSVLRLDHTAMKAGEQPAAWVASSRASGMRCRSGGRAPACCQPT